MQETRKEKYSIYPLEALDLWDMYKATEKQVWKAQELDFSNDDFDNLDESQQRYLKMLIFFFANADSIVADNLAINFLQEDIPEEAKFFYSYQLYNENVHSESYALIIDNYIKSEQEKLDAYRAIHTIPTVARKMQWAEQWIDNGTLEEKLIAFAAVEMILFSSTFAGIFGFKSLRKPLEGLYVANEWISRDENQHGEFAIQLYNNYIPSDRKLSNDRVKEILLEAYEVEKQYIDDSFLDGVTGFNKDQMIQYVQYVTDVVLSYFGLDANFHVNQPFEYMAAIGISRRDNFFEKTVTEYTKLNRDELDFNNDDF